MSVLKAAVFLGIELSYKPNRLTTYWASTKIHYFCSGKCPNYPGQYSRKLCWPLSIIFCLSFIFHHFGGHHNGFSVLVQDSMWTALDLKLNSPRLDPSRPDTHPLASLFLAVAGNISQHFYWTRPSLSWEQPVVTNSVQLLHGPEGHMQQVGVGSGSEQCTFSPKHRDPKLLRF